MGVFSNINNDATSAAAKSKTAWKNKTSIFVPNGNRWFPAITSNFGANKFALTSMDDFTSVPLPTVPMQNSLTLTTSVNPSATAFLNLTLTFRIFYSRYFADGTSLALENCNVEVSTNGGTTWAILPGGTLTADQGFGSTFVTLTYNLNAYIASNNLKVRIRVLGDGTGTGTAGDGAAIDDVKLFGDRPLTPFFALGGGVDAYTDAATTIPYVGDERSTIWIKPTLTQLEQPAFVINVTANLNNGCTTGGVVNVTNNTKVWKGTTNSDWNTATNWAPATVPTIANCVIIPTATPNPTILSTGAAGNGKNLLIKTGGILEIQSGNALTIKETVDVNATGTFNIKDNSSLVQIDNVANPTVAGTFNMERIADLRSRDYCYWSSPVGNLLAGTFPIASVSPLTPTSLIFNWVTTGVNSYGGQGNWVNTTENMIPTKGYIVRGPSTFNNVTTTPLTANFTGTPNNGTFTTTIFRGTDLLGTSPIKTITDDNWNLLGNPYPSAIGVNEFLDANSFAVPTNDIQGFVKIWTHGILPTTLIADPFYQNFVYNYDTNDYITINKTAAVSAPGDYKIGAGQGFMVLMDDGVAGSGTVTFNNTMRSASFANTQFYKTASPAHATTTIERNRIWLDLVPPTGSANRIVVGYIDGATQAKDNLYDAFTDYKPSQNFYSLIDDEPMLIQGRSLPFDANDTVPMGVKIPTNGTYTIAIAAVDGLFAGNTQTIYLEDKLLNVIHNLTASQYQFTANQGIANDRFVLRYNIALSNNEFDYSNEVKIFTNNSINISSASQSIKEVVVYDILGKVLVDKTNIGKNEISLNELKPTSTILIVKVILENNEVVVKKVIF
ncbi:T9SS sorting signal type C domain-containing protein [Flavobacterium sp.]|uniref:T9SS sorting signal type C domain-containing protein n=1 Tax=Flavobacterium sp. TaxID=239 RepID=UPI00374C9506